MVQNSKGILDAGSPGASMIEAIREEEKENELNFTGNWFIDAGIIGFVNLMEDVYGWDLKKLQEMIAKEPEKAYYGFFPIAFIHYNLIDEKTKKQEKTKQQFYEEVNSIFGNLSSQNNQDIFDKAWKFISENYSTNGRVNLRPKGLYYYFKNFLFFQPGWDGERQKEAFQEILGFIEPKSEVLKNMDKTENKFLPSADEFFNVIYTKSFIEVSALKKILPNSNFIFVLTFPFAFIPIKSEKDNMFFYSPNLELTYGVNKKLKIMKEKMTKRDSIFHITWNAVLDSAIESESIWSIENMYLIEYKLGKNQNIFNVIYIGIPKLQASIFLDDAIRKALNKNIQFRPKKYCWLIEEFIEGRSLYPIILDHVTLVLNGVLDEIQYRSSLYALIIDSKILELRTKKTENKKRALFSEDYFGDYRSLVREIKEEIRYTSFVSSVISRILEDQDTRHKIARDLLNALKARDKNAFLNILLRNLNGAKLRENTNFSYQVNNWIFDKIITNNISFEMYGLILIANLMRGEKNE